MGKIFNLNGLITESFEVPFNSELKIDNFLNDSRLKGLFKKVCNVVIDNHVNEKGHQLRKTEIMFSPIINTNKWSEEIAWVYIITFNGYVVKFGGTGTGLKGRTGSYLCGSRWNREKGTCSTTNFIIYNAILQYLEQGVLVEMYAYELPKYDLVLDVFGTEKTENLLVNKAYEKELIDIYVNITGNKPCLSNNK
jgi:hypothetical protein